MPPRPSRAAAALASYHVDDSAHTGLKGHLEVELRVKVCLAHLAVCGLWPKLKALPARSASDTELQLCHDIGHIRGLKAAARQAAHAKRVLYLPVGGRLSAESRPTGREFGSKPTLSAGPGQDTYVTGGSLHAARTAAGGLLSLVDESMTGGGLCRGLALCRPPGHHAGRASSEGFCLVNNVAIAAAYALSKHADKVSRVLIVDWDVHHCQGTQEIFWESSDVLLFSAHRRSEPEEQHFYPGSGSIEEVGEGPGQGFTVNVPLPSAYDDACLWAACAEVLLPAARRFKPDLILVSAGFDAVEGDPLGGCCCTPEGYAFLTTELRKLAGELCHGRLLLALEGGYDPGTLGVCVAKVAEALTADSALAATDSSSAAFRDRPPWLGTPAQHFRAAIHAARAAHRDLPLRLLDGYASSMYPFAPRHCRQTPNMTKEDAAVAGGAKPETADRPSQSPKRRRAAARSRSGTPTRRPGEPDRAST